MLIKRFWTGKDKLSGASKTSSPEGYNPHQSRLAAVKTEGKSLFEARDLALKSEVTYDQLAMCEAKGNIFIYIHINLTIYVYCVQCSGGDVKKQLPGAYNDEPSHSLDRLNTFIQGDVQVFLS